MKCQKCGKKEANTHIKRVVNGEYEEYMLCSDCAHALGYDNVFDFDMPDMFGGLLQSVFRGALPSRSGAARCPECGSTQGDITNTGKVGCANCYSLFAEQLLPSVKRIHGNTTHCGKVSGSRKAEAAPSEPTKEEKIEKMKAQLEEAIKEQNFELAAELRDKIKAEEAK